MNNAVLRFSRAVKNICIHKCMHTEIDGEQSLSSTYCLEQGTRDTCSPHCLKQSTHISLFLFGSHFFCLKQSTHDTCSPRCPSRRGSTRRGPSGRRRSLRSGLRKGCSATTRPQPHARVRRDVPQEPEEKIRRAFARAASQDEGAHLQVLVLPCHLYPRPRARSASPETCAASRSAPTRCM